MNVLNDFFIILFSIIVEGIPFLLIGAILSGVIEIYVSREKLLSLLPQSGFFQYLGFAGLGNVLPVCECGNIPVAKKLIQKGIPPHLALVFLLAAPVLNPLTLLATWAAFPDDYTLLFWRIFGTLFVAIFAGYIVSKAHLLDFIHPEIVQAKNSECHSHAHKTQDLLSHISKDFIHMLGIFFFGAAIAASVQLFAPKDLVMSFQDTIWMSLIAMMFLGFVISICSNVDAFFALSYAHIFPKVSIIAFLIFGPMIDIKSIPLYRSIFMDTFFIPFILLVFSLVYLLCFSLQYFVI